MTANTGFKLILREGPTPGQAFELDRPEVVIGRDASADLVIPSPAVSRRHARVTRQGDQHLLEDLGSSNGTFLNGQRLAQVLMNGSTRYLYGLRRIGEWQVAGQAYHLPDVLGS